MIKDTKEGTTHYQDDGCGEPAHNCCMEGCGNIDCRHCSPMEKEHRKLDKKIAAVRKELGEVSICCGYPECLRKDYFECGKCGKPFVPHPRKQLPANSDNIGRKLAVEDINRIRDFQEQFARYEDVIYVVDKELDTWHFTDNFAVKIDELISSTRSSVLREVEGEIELLHKCLTELYSYPDYKVGDIVKKYLQTLKKLRNER